MNFLKQIEREEKLELPEVKVLENHKLFQEIFRVINLLYVKAAQQEVPILFKFNQKGEGVRVITTVYHKDEITYELQIENVKKVKTFYIKVDNILSQILSFEQEYQMWVRRSKRENTPPLEYNPSLEFPFPEEWF